MGKCPDCGFLNKDKALSCFACEVKIQDAPVPKRYSLKRTPINKVSKKQAEINKKKKATYKEMDSKTPQICSGCGLPNKVLSHSHLIPQSRRKDLIDDPENIVYHCLQVGESLGCHDIWEHSKRERVMLKDYVKNMAYIKRVDPEYYELLTSKNFIR